ncbi:MAG: hypothetical protein JPMHGGIA_01817 [Saprospiraceae bacterium]|jgi:hypothetical protein|nr:hypothetical protein [Saprospiraceae bacterium]
MNREYYIKARCAGWFVSHNPQFSLGEMLYSARITGMVVFDPITIPWYNKAELEDGPGQKLIPESIHAALILQNTSACNADLYNALITDVHIDVRNRHSAGAEGRFEGTLFATLRRDMTPTDPESIPPELADLIPNERLFTLDSPQTVVNPVPTVNIPGGCGCGLPIRDFLLMAFLLWLLWLLTNRTCQNGPDSSGNRPKTTVTQDTARSSRLEKENPPHSDTVFTQSESAKLYVRDGEWVDGDKVSLSLNGMKISEELLLDGSFSGPWDLSLHTGENVLEISTFDMGESASEATPQIRVVFPDGSEQLFNASTQQGKPYTLILHR